MSTNSKTEQLWNGAIEFATPAPDPSLAAREEQLTKFREHKEVLLSHLENAYDRSPKAEPFDKDKSWSQIETLAYIQYYTHRIGQQAMGAGERRTRHREIADVLTRARSMIEDAMRSPDLADDLIGSWWHGTTEYEEAGGRFVDLLYIEREFEKVTKGLAVLEEAAVRASNGAQQGPGRPRGSSVLWPAYIRPLADLYRKCTGLKPGAGQGPFARFVGAYVTAIGLGLIGEDRLVEIIKDVRARTLMKSSKSGPSPFED
jgi:hypothetical protein